MALSVGGPVRITPPFGPVSAPISGSVFAAFPESIDPRLRCVAPFFARVRRRAGSGDIARVTDGRRLWRERLPSPVPLLPDTVPPDCRDGCPVDTAGAGVDGGHPSSGTWSGLGVLGEGFKAVGVGLLGIKEAPAWEGSGGGEAEVDGGSRRGSSLWSKGSADKSKASCTCDKGWVSDPPMCGFQRSIVPKRNDSPKFRKDMLASKSECSWSSVASPKTLHIRSTQAEHETVQRIETPNA